MGNFLNVADIVQGLHNVFGFNQLLWLVIGIVLGLFGGTLPGISGATMLAVLVGFVFKFPLDCMVIALAGICAASTYSGSTAGILYNVPGDAPGIPSTIEGYQMTKRGESLDALTAAISASFFGGVLSSVLVIVTVPVFLLLVTFVGSGERALFALWAMVIVSGGALTRDDTLRGIVSMGVGLFIGTIGMQANVGSIRYVFNFPQFWDGIDMLWVILGIYAIPQILKLPYIKIDKDKEVKVSLGTFLRSCRGHFKNYFWLMTKAGLLGTLIGAIPGIGSVTGSWVGYSTAQKDSRHPEMFGKGAVDGIIGAESANNAAVPGTFIPLLSLGIPGSASSAIILGAFIAQGIFPGPQLMQTNGAMVWTIMFGIGLSSFAFVILGIPFIRLAQSMVGMPSRYLIASIGVLTVLGTYLSKYNSLGILATIIIGVIVIAATTIGLIPSAMLMGFILGPTIEVEFVRAFQIAGFARFTRPASLVLLIITVATFMWGIIKSVKERRRLQEKKNKNTQRIAIPSENDVKGKMDELEEDDAGSALVSALHDVIFGVLAILLAAFIFYEMRSILPLARIWSYIVAGFFLALPAVLLLVRGLASPGEIMVKIKALPGEGMRVLRDRKSLDAVVMLGGMALSVLLIDVLGFIGSVMLFTAIVLYYFHPKIGQALLGTAGMGFIIWLMKVTFTFSLPSGLIPL